MARRTNRSIRKSCNWTQPLSGFVTTARSPRTWIFSKRQNLRKTFFHSGLRVKRPCSSMPKTAIPFRPGALRSPKLTVFLILLKTLRRHGMFSD